jgi:hypothetical protein
MPTFYLTVRDGRTVAVHEFSDFTASPITTSQPHPMTENTLAILLRQQSRKLRDRAAELETLADTVAQLPPHTAHKLFPLLGLNIPEPGHASPDRATDDKVT